MIKRYFRNKKFNGLLIAINLSKNDNYKISLTEDLYSNHYYRSVIHRHPPGYIALLGKVQT